MRYEVGKLNFVDDQSKSENGSLEWAPSHWSPEHPIHLVPLQRIGSPFSGLRKRGERSQRGADAQAFFKHDECKADLAKSL